MKHFLLILLLIFLGFACTSNHSDTPETPDTSFTKVIKNKELKAIVNFNSIDYYIDRGTPVGYQLDLLNAYCEHIHVKLTPIVRESNKKEYFSLADHEADLIVGDINPTSFRKNLFSFTLPHSISPLMLIRRADSSQNQPLKAGQHLAIHIPAHSSYYDYVRSWAAKNAMVADIIFDDEHSTENLIEKVALGEIDYTISEQKVAMNNNKLFRNLDYSIVISEPLEQCWVLPKSSDSLRKSIDLWLESFLKTDEYKAIYSRYYNTTFDRQILKNRHSYMKKKTICRWDRQLKKVSRKNRWDWKILAALIYQESGFQPNIVGGGGCIGLLQLMPETAKRYGITPNSSPEIQITRGAQYIKYLENFYNKKVKDKEQLSKFVLASFNAGPGHVIDAINLTEKYGKDPTRWDDNVEVFLRYKSVPKYYNDPVVKSGYYRGAYTICFVNDVWERYLHYKNFVR
jgi:membrane-bound lytic murein transglycosylase F